MILSSVVYKLLMSPRVDVRDNVTMATQRFAYAIQFVDHESVAMCEGHPLVKIVAKTKCQPKAITLVGAD
ncbi:hypothetical protein M8J77_009255 [Diaphorina citri]|nr:hypothetical protein M8J77_009255 [Diaphorina citri]